MRTPALRMSTDDQSSGASISLQWVLGASTSAGVKSIDEDTLLYLSGNVGVIYGISKKEQKLLRGHVRFAGRGEG